MYCTMCPNNCNVDRKIGVGACLADEKIRISYHGLHMWEEPVISGGKGSGAIFFSGCTMRCIFCQNSKISRTANGKIFTENGLAKLFEKYDTEADNVNLVSPTPYVDGILHAAEIYYPSNPVIYNTSGYEKSETVRLLDDVVNVWLPDLKYVDSNLSRSLSGKSDYFKYTLRAIEQMIKQTGKPIIKDGLIKSGVIIRHLILPSHIDNTLAVLKVFADNFKEDAMLSLMAQYVPFNVENVPEINRKITSLEYKRALNALDELGITNGFVQEISSATKDYIPDF